MAVLALVALVLAGGATAVAAPGIANEVARQFKRGLCLVGGGDCSATERQACTVRTTSTDGSVTAKLAFFRLGRGLGLLRAEQSDGSVDLTLLEHLDAGVEAGLGAEGHLRLGSIDLGGGGLVQAEAIARLGGGRSWHIRGRPEADALQGKLVRALAGQALTGLPGIGVPIRLTRKLLGGGAKRRLPEPDTVTVSGEVAGKAEVRLGDPSRAGLGAGLMAGGQRQRATGRRTVFLRLDASATAHLATDLVRVTGGDQLTASYTVDRAGRPLSFAVAARGEAAAGLGLAGGARASGAAKGGDLRSGEITATLDLTRADNAAAVHRLLAALVPGPAVAGLPAALAHVGRRLASDAQIDLRRYTTQQSEYGGGGELALGAKVGIDVSLTRASARLLDAWARPGGGAWARRVDCFAT